MNEQFLNEKLAERLKTAASVLDVFPAFEIFKDGPSGEEYQLHAGQKYFHIVATDEVDPETGQPKSFQYVGDGFGDKVGQEPDLNEIAKKGWLYDIRYVKTGHVTKLRPIKEEGLFDDKGNLYIRIA